MKRIWRFDFKVSTTSLNKTYDLITKEDREYLSAADVSSSFDVELKNKCQSYLIATKETITIYKDMFSKYGIKCKLTDVTKDVLSGKLDMERDLVDFLGTEKSLNVSYFLDSVEKLVYENLSMDGILDKISKMGLDSLTRTEKKYMDDISQKI